MAVSCIFFVQVLSMVVLVFGPSMVLHVNRLSLVDGVVGSLPDDPRQQSVRWPQPSPDVWFLYRDDLVYFV